MTGRDVDTDAMELRLGQRVVESAPEPLDVDGGELTDQAGAGRPR